MKKILIIVLSFLSIGIVGCGKKEVTLDLEKIQIEINNMTYKVEDKTESMFPSNKTITSELLKDKYGIDTSSFDEFVISVPEMLDTASMYAIVKPNKGEESKAKEQMNAFFQKYDQQWTMGYFPEEEVLVKKRLDDKVGNYLVYIISHDNDAVLNKIKNTK